MVTITGANLGASPGGSTVSFNGVAATPTSWSATSIVAAVPAGANTGNVVAMIAGVPSNGLSFTVSSAGGGGGGGGGGLSPFNGTPALIPGQIDAANFDNGGEGVAYHDTSAGNSGGQYRQTGVDIEASSEGGFDVGWTAAGEWINYTVSVASAGNYTVQLRVASPGGASLHLGFNASNVWKTVPIPATGAWQTWQTVTVPVTLAAGVQQMTVQFDNGGMNLLYANVTSSSGGGGGSGGGGLTPFSGTPVSLPGTVAASDFDNGGEGVAYHDTSAGNSGGQYRNTSVDLEASSEGGFDVGWTAAGEWLTYTVNVASAGNYTVQLRVASPGGASLHLGFNTASNVWKTVSIPATGSWQAWQTVSVPVTLGAGTQQMTVQFDNGGMNLLYANVTSSGGGGGGGGGGGLTPFSGTPVALPGTVNAANFDNGGEGVAYHDTSAGNSGGQYRSTDVDLEASSEGGFDVGWTAPGEWLNYTVNVTSAGNRTVLLRVASPGGATIHVGFNTASNVWKTISIPATGGWQNWQTISVPVTLGPGVQQLTLLFDTGGMNIRTIVVN
jgi:hypothetical protein